MKTKNIVIGKRYRNDYHPGFVYLGIGQHDNTEKGLIIIETPKINYDTRSQVGVKVLIPNKARDPWFWMGFSPLDK